MSRWPRDNQAELIKFYGDPGRGEVERQLVKVVPPFQMYYDGRRLPFIRFHKKAASALFAALTDIWEHYGKNQATIDKLGISKCAGTYNPRKVRGSKTKWSNHAFGAAIDINAEENGFNAKSTIPQPVVDAFKRQGARWGGDYKTRKDPMHFEFCDASPVRTASLGDTTLPEMDSDSDAPDTGMDMSAPPPHDVAPDAPVRVDTQPWYGRAWAWVSGGGVGALGFGSIYDWRVAAIFGVLAFGVFLFVWFGYLRPKLRKELGA